MTVRKKIFVLGGTGFVGSAVTRELDDHRSDNELMLLIHRTAPFRQLERINTNTGSLGGFDLSLLDRFQPDVIVHLARMSGRGRLGRQLAAWRGARANRRILRHLAARQVRPQVIYVSGTLVYGDCGDKPVDEDRPLNPIAFAREYHRAEQPWEEAASVGPVPVTILRPPWIIGGNSWFTEYYVKNIRIHRFVPLFGDGQNLMSLLDVADCAGLIAHAVRHARPGERYNLFAPGACLTQAEFAERLAQATGTVIRRFGLEETERRFGRTMREAFTFSNQSATKHPEFLGGYQFRHSTIDAMIGNHLPAELCVRPAATS
jgi:nucleoside-diphosphate-sugar epimerase